MNPLFTNNNDEDSDSDFDPYELQMHDTQPNNNTTTTANTTTNSSNHQKHRYHTRSTSMLNRNNTNNNSNKDTQPDTNNTENKNNKKKRGRPKSKRRKKKSNHIDTSSKHKNRTNSEELKVDKYDTQQYIESVTNAINNGTYLHPFLSKPSSLPKRRIGKIMKLDPTKFKISSITLELMAVLIEIFIRDLISRSYKYTIEDNRRSLQLQDICRAVQSDHMYDFLIDIVPRIQSYDQESNVYNFIYTSQMENCVLTSGGGRNNINQLQKDEEKKMNIDEKNDSENDSENRLVVRRSKRIKSKRSDKEEAD